MRQSGIMLGLRVNTLYIIRIEYPFLFMKTRNFSQNSYGIIRNKKTVGVLFFVWYWPLIRYSIFQNLSQGI
jgi:hypothetical protein